MMRASLCLFALVLGAVPLAAQKADAPSANATSARLSADQIAEVVSTLASVAEARYVDPAGGAKIAARLRENLSRGRYSSVTDPVELAARLTADLYATVPDVHLRVAYEPNRSAQTLGPRTANQPASGAQPFSRIDPRSTQAIARSNFGFEAIEVLDGNVGYMKIAQFVPPEMSETTARAAMTFLSGSDAMIVDLRGNIGGSPELVRYLLSHFTGPDPVSLMARYMREGDRTETMLSMESLPGKRRQGTPLYVLIDRNSASAAEMFAYLVQQNRLGTVYGQTSRGAGQGGNMIPIGSGLSAFIPFTRIVGGPGWEGVGVRPDIAVDLGDPLDVAHRAALQQLVARASDGDIRREREWALEMVEARHRPVNGRSDLGRFEGQFGSRAFRVREGRLYAIGAGGREDMLVRIGDGVFRTRTARYSFTAPTALSAGKVIVESLSGTRSELDRTSASLST